MELKTYQGKSMAEALEKVKKDLGRGAVILHTRTIRRGGVMGVGARSIVEITASREAALLPRADRPAIISRREGQKGGTTSGRDIGGHVSRAAQTGAYRTSSQAEETAVQGSSATASPNSPTGRSDRGRRDTGGPDVLQQITSSTVALRNEMEELRGMVRQLIDRQPSELPAGTVTSADSRGVKAAAIPEELRDYYTTLIQNAVADELARDVIVRAKERLNEWRSRLQKVGPLKTEPLDIEKLIPNALMEVIEKMLPPADPVQILPNRGPKFVALVGPTGVGKTTTIAKLAAQFKLRERKRVGLITTDTYRIAAVAQLKAYAEILSVPLEVVYTPDELQATMQKMQGFDIVLIDTSGRSQNDSEHLGELKAFLAKARDAAAAREAATSLKSETGTEAATPEAATEEASAAGNPLETHLVMSCTAHPSQLQQVIEKFMPLGVDRVVFTKLDEAVGVGVILNIAQRLDVQLSYLTTGQDVPDDIEVSSRRRIAEMVLAQRKPEAAKAADAAVGVDAMA